jgi:hypothetical protein
MTQWTEGAEPRGNNGRNVQHDSADERCRRQWQKWSSQRAKCRGVSEKALLRLDRRVRSLVDHKKVTESRGRNVTRLCQPQGNPAHEFALDAKLHTLSSFLAHES